MPTLESDWVTKLARHIAALGLTPLALPLLETARAFRPLGSSGMLLAWPLLRGLVEENTLARTAALLDDPDSLSRLQRLLEEGG